MVAKSHPPVVFGAATNNSAETINDQSGTADEADERLKARAARFHTDYKPATALAPPPKASKPVLGADFDLLNQAEVEKRRQRARKFGTALVEDGLQPALTSQQATKAQQKAEHVAAAAVSGDVEITEAELADQAEQRRQSALTAERRPDTVHLHGVHFMTTSDCLHFFATYGAASVEWLGDSACNVVFPDADSASKAVLGNGIIAPAEDAPDGFGFTEADAGDITHMWHKGQGFAKGVVDDFPVQLFFRIATVADVRQKGQEAYLKQQGGGRGKKAHRGKGKGRGRGRGGRGQQQNQQQKRQFQDVDGDVDMRHRGERGGKRVQRRKTGASSGYDIEMQEAEAFDDAGDHLTNAEVRQAAANGNAGFSQQAYGPGTMFSAAAAGAAVAPGFQQYAPVPTQDVRDTKLIDYGDI